MYKSRTINDFILYRILEYILSNLKKNYSNNIKSESIRNCGVNNKKLFNVTFLT